jgi:hypothetical protein
MLDNFTFHQERRIVSQTAAEMKGIPPMKARKTPEILPQKCRRYLLIFIDIIAVQQIGGYREIWSFQHRSDWLI